MTIDVHHDNIKYCLILFLLFYLDSSIREILKLYLCRLSLVRRPDLLVQHCLLVEVGGLEMSGEMSHTIISCVPNTRDQMSTTWTNFSADDESLDNWTIADLDCKDIPSAPVEKLAEEDVADLEKKAALKKKVTTGLHFSNIPKDVRVSEFKNVLRERNLKLVFVKWKAFKQSAIGFFEDELDVVMNNLDGLTLQEELVMFEVVPRSGGREPSKRPPKARKPIGKEEGGQRKKKGVKKEEEAEKARKRMNRREQRMKRRKDFGGKFGIFVGKIPKGVTREDLRQEFDKLNVPLPDYFDWVLKKGHAFAFWQETDASLSLEAFTGISVGGTTLQVELYDTNRPKFMEERRKEEN